MERLRDSTWQFTITLVISLVSLLFTVLSFPSDTLRVVGVIVVLILIFGIVLINLLPSSKTVRQQQNSNIAPIASGSIPPGYSNQQASSSSLIPVSRQPSLSRTKRWVLIFTLAGWVVFFSSFALAGSSSWDASAYPIPTAFFVIGLILVFGFWIISLVNTARLGYWGSVLLIFLLPLFGTFIYIFFVPNTARKALSQTYFR